MSVYRVRGLYWYRGHRPGSVFEATLEPEDERRAIQRGNIEVVIAERVTLDESKIRRPKG